jgi:hypothetical protein
VITIQHKWVDRDGDSVRDPDEIVRYDKFSVPPENFANGNPVEIVTVTGQSADGKSTIVAEVTKKTMTVRTLGALYVDRPVTLTGDCAFCGYNHSYDTPIGYRPAGSGSSSGSGPGGGGSGGSGGSASAGDCEDYHLAGGHLSGVTGTGAQIQTQGSTCIMGDPAPINNSSSNPFYGLNEVLGMPSNEVQEMLAKADNTGIVNPLNGITYIQGNASIMSNLSGEGLVYITGDLHASGKFDFKGLIYVEGDVHLSGSPWILGSLIVRGITDFNFSAGHATVLYSSEALTRSLNNSMPAMVLSWKEM